ncbi:SIR2 family NAD-dependent protein deacylase [Ktedonobacter racemifer]|uniref:protein acetyllysine N-acetyltransferase n=1 Tax=Ktedonobacter racemifer DSM 44963 TaxID=485913 RepID=D6THN4_KTERA|nr:Sir2 family NAD-dependent protein deacetylase [Ktedonobacter racemifer]EFH89039.1 Silent information regulator protein Sir2 [Ktedonobacter racemifer DSM 44963]
MLTLQEQLQDATELLQVSRRIAVLTGAGISTESGIPDFRGPGSIWRANPPVSYRDFINSAEARQKYWATRRQLRHQVGTAHPNAAHLALANLERLGLLLGLITQNFDGLHQDAGNTPERVVEMHGTSRVASCTLCEARSSIEALQQRIDDGERDPQCPLCGGYLKAATILFDQRIPESELSRAKEYAAQCDLFMVIGSSLKVTPASTLPRIALRRNVPLIIINLEPTTLDTYADVAIHRKAGEILPSLVKSLTPDA